MPSGGSPQRAFVGIAAFERRVVDALHRTFLLRAMRSAAVGVAVVFGGLMLFAGGDPARGGLLRQALLNLAGIAFCTAWLWSGRRTAETYASVSRLLRLRGLRWEQEHTAEALGGGLFLGRILWVPILVLCLARLGMARDFGTVGLIAVQSAGALFFGLVCVLTFAALAFLSRTLAPERSRLVFSLLVLGPFLLGWALGLPHLPGALVSVLDLSVGQGAAP